MSLRPDGLLTVVGDVDTITDKAASGTVTVRLSDKLVVGDKVYAPIDQTVALNPNDGTFSVKLPPTGDTGVTYKFTLVAYAYVNGQREHFEESFNTVLSADDGDADGVVQYKDLAPVATPGVPSTFLTRTAADTRYLLKDEVPELPVDLVTTDDLTAAIAAIPTLDQANLLKVQAGTPDAMVTGAITRDANNAATGFDVLWPDGATGRFTGTPSPSFPGAVDAYTITHVLAGVTSTYTQAAVTRNAAGTVTTRPAITVTGGLPPVTPIVPVAPTLSVTSKTDTQVVLAGAGGSNVASLVVKRGTTTVGTGLPVTDTGLTASTAYTYTVTATSSTGDTAKSTLTVTTSAAPDTTAPTAPTSVTATAGDASAQVAFSGASDNVAVTGYRVYTASTGGSPVASGTSSPITVSGLTNGTAYTLYVSALDAAGNESTRAASNSVTPAAAVTVPTGTPTVTRGTSTVTTQPLTWTAVSGATAYDVEHKATSGSTWTVDTTNVTGTSYTVTGLTASTSYDYRVRARNSAGPAASYSTVVTGSTSASGGGSPVFTFTDDFQRADGALGNGWVSTKPEVRDAQLAPVFTAGTSSTVYAVQGTAAPAGSLLRVELTNTVAGTISGPTTITFTPVFGLSGASDFTSLYVVDYDTATSAYRLRKTSGGTTTVLTTFAASAPSAPYTMGGGIKAISGTGVATLALYVGGQEVATVDDSTPLAGRYFGARVYGNNTGTGNNARADNYTATAYTA